MSIGYLFLLKFSVIHEKRNAFSRFHADFSWREKREKGQKSADYLRNSLCFFTISRDSMKKRGISRIVKPEFRFVFKQLEYNSIPFFTISRPRKRGERKKAFAFLPPPLYFRGGFDLI